MTPETIRCAIYVRKSNPNGLEQEFNSLDNQRLRCEDRIRSKSEMGWVIVDDEYEDGGISGEKITNRPGVKKLLSHIDAGLINVVVVYKLDRLTRSTIDAIQLFDMFSKKNVDFVSLTENIDTSTPGGRMVMTVLAAMGQMERELASERVRDKVASSKKLGYWMGGCPPLGYDIVDRSLIINEPEAEIIRFIFTEYIKTRSVSKVVRMLREKGYKTKAWGSRSGRTYTGQPFAKNAVDNILKNPIYCGKIAHRGENYPGRHEAIISEEEFTNANGIPQHNHDHPAPISPLSDEAPLKQLARCGECGCPMSPTFSRKKNRHYRYYICNRYLRGVSDDCSIKRVPAGEIELLVEQEVRSILQSEAFSFACACEQDKLSIQDIRLEFARFEQVWDELFWGEKAKIISNLVHTVEVFTDKINISFSSQALGTLLSEITSKPCFNKYDAKVGELVCRSVPIRIERKNKGKAVMICQPGNHMPVDKEELGGTALYTAMLLAWKWHQGLQRGVYASLEDIAQREQKKASYISRIFRMNFLAPDIVEAIVNGTAPRTLTLKDINRDELPVSWPEQRKKYGFVAV